VIGELRSLGLDEPSLEGLGALPRSIVKPAVTPRIAADRKKKLFHQDLDRRRLDPDRHDLVARHDEHACCHRVREPKLEQREEPEDHEHEPGVVPGAGFGTCDGDHRDDAEPADDGEARQDGLHEPLEPPCEGEGEHRHAERADDRTGSTRSEPPPRERRRHRGPRNTAYRTIASTSANRARGSARAKKDSEKAASNSLENRSPPSVDPGRGSADDVRAGVPAG
jgi:hypothetical protein